ncbi:MAG TPA: BON domain-containing protein [Pyrinomonadaceae bacterium]|nr:BON domain-containing protein [Pyrinomonadaceae bacterium]
MFVKVVRILMVVMVVGILATAQSVVAQTNPRIVREVRHELVTLPYYGVFDWLTYQVQNDGTVVLSGQVVRPSTKSDAEGRVKEIDGVSRVSNQIEVLPNSPSDDRLRIALYRQIYGFNSPLFRYATQSVPSIHIIVNHGHVTLRGVAANKGDANLAYIRARTVPGSFSVSNELSIEGQEPR